MAEIETTEESQACRAAMERLAECGWSLEDEDDNLALIRMWVHGRDYALAEARGDGLRALLDDAIRVLMEACHDPSPRSSKEVDDEDRWYRERDEIEARYAALAGTDAAPKGESSSGRYIKKPAWCTSCDNEGRPLVALLDTVTGHLQRICTPCADTLIEVSEQALIDRAP